MHCVGIARYTTSMSMALALDSSSTIIVQIGVLLLSLGVLYRIISSSTRLPPGPSPIPLLGHFDIPKNYRPLFEQWAKQYPGIMFTRIMGLPFVIVNSRQAAADLLERQATATFGRPHQVMADEL